MQDTQRRPRRGIICTVCVCVCVVALFVLFVFVGVLSFVVPLIYFESFVALKKEETQQLLQHARLILLDLYFPISSTPRS